MKTKVKDLSPSLDFISDSQHVRPINEVFGTDFDAFFVMVEDGDFSAVWGMRGIIPDLQRRVEQVWPKGGAA
jgi:hypothetical protein